MGAPYFNYFFNYQKIRSFRYTYHPAEEIRVQREISRLMADPLPFGGRKVPHISQNAQVRIIEELTLSLRLPNSRLLEVAHFRGRLPGWKNQLFDLYAYYHDLRLENETTGRTIDFMLDYLGMPRLDNLPLSEQITLLKAYSSRIAWDTAGKTIKRHLVERLAEEVDIPHPRMLTDAHFRTIVIPEIGTTLIGLHQRYHNRASGSGRTIDKLLDDIGIPSYESQSWEQQVSCLRQCRKICWERIPASTQLKLLSLLGERIPPKNGVSIPHLRALTKDAFWITIKEMDGGLTGLLGNYARKTPKDYKGTTIDYMLDSLGVAKFEELSFELQCQCLKYTRNLLWSRFPRTAILRLLERLKELAGLPHLRFLRVEHFRTIKIPEINQTIGGLYVYACEKIAPPDTKDKDVVDILLDHYGVEKIFEMSFRLQLQLLQLPKRPKWSRIPPAVIAYELDTLRRTVGGGKLSWKDFQFPTEGRRFGLSGLYQRLRTIRPPQSAHERFSDWALREYKLALREQIIAKRRLNAGLLSGEEKEFLLQRVKLGNEEALDHLIFFYQPLIKGCVWMALARFPSPRQTFEELLQEGVTYFPRLIQNYAFLKGSFETYARKSLTLYLLRIIICDTGVIHVPARHLEEMRQLKKTTGILWRRLNRAPSETELAQELNIPVAEIHVMRLFLTDELSLQQPIGTEESFAFEDVIADEHAPRQDESWDKSELEQKLRQAIEGSGLNANEKLVIEKRWLEERTLEDVGAELFRTGERIRQIESAALEKIRNGPYAAILKGLL